MEDALKTPASGRKSYIKSMFDSIALKYDFLNHFLSLGIDRNWRKKAITIISKSKKNPRILDVATGTADLSIAALKINPCLITGIDISEGMLRIGVEKIKKLGLAEKIELMYGDSEQIPFPDESFDVTMVAFGVRNFSDIEKGLSEMHRVLKKDGMIMVLEFSKPDNIIFNRIYLLYFRKILPFLGRFFSGDRNAYSYLPDSVMKFPDNERFLRLLQNAGFVNSGQKRLTGGIASIYTGFRNKQ
ncbi:MAG TPA: bifunctional demethylmenaquinone methyltransferase/2-methoxy-6-polyprenyl-1,4-benzoquinol methylase UbiE [Bacteroidales bacterium]|nr:bifunctional demethylmenaquinone methyltransferase/2-methoxy-6-polyprenyl-1,4-benzoquinol methylase UbiE [Bacteroidales bacterium]